MLLITSTISLGLILLPTGLPLFPGVLIDGPDPIGRSSNLGRPLRFPGVTLWEPNLSLTSPDVALLLPSV